VYLLEISLENKIFTYSISCQGASHIRENMPCQDSFLIKEFNINDNNIVIMAIADGHGSKAYDLSEYGSKIAVESSIDIMVGIYENFSATKKELYNSIRFDFPKRLSNLWHERVIEDIKNRDFKFFDENKDNILRIYKRYGTTLIVCLICPKGIFFGQIGDGNILVIDELEGELISYYPITDKSNLLSNETYSLTSQNQLNLWNFNCLTPDKKSLIFMCTDGLYNCFETDEQFEILPKSLYSNLVKCNNKIEFENVINLLPKYLNKVSKEGSGDDISVALALVDENFITIE